MTTTPAPRDERELFEKWAKGKWPALSFHRRDALPEDHDMYGWYVDEFVSWRWHGWQKRAALAESELAEVRDELTNTQELLGRASHDRDQQCEMKVRAREQRDSFTTELEELRAELERVKSGRNQIGWVVPIAGEWYFHTQRDSCVRERDEYERCMSEYCEHEEPQQVYADAAIDAARGVEG